VKDLFRLIITLIIACVLIGIVSYFLTYNKQYSIEELDKLITNEPYEKTFDDVGGIDILGESVRSFFEFFNLDTISITVSVSSDRISIMPISDFLNSQTYYYKGEKLVLYISSSNTIGGDIRYYFSNGKFIGTKKTDGQNEIDVQLENENDIIKRAQKIFDTYMK
jgi:hypothetical protein